MNYQDVMLEERACPLGCSPRDERVTVGRDLLHDLPGEYAVVRCETCGLMRTDPRPDSESLSFYYPESYRPYQAAPQTREMRERGWKKNLKNLGKRLLQTNVERLPRFARPGRMLEIGCAGGVFLQRMKNAGWRVEGIEFSETAAQTARDAGHKVYAGTLESAPTPTHNYDLIVGWMVLEHLPDPIAALARLRAWTNPRGWLVLSVPNAGSYEFSLFKDSWFALQLPTHLYHFTPTTLAAVLERGGWQLKRVHHQREISNLVASMGYRLRARNRAPRLAEKLIAFPWRAGKSAYLLHPLGYLLSLGGQTGRMTVWAQRKD